MSKAPSFQFYPGDWLKDPALRLCSPAARGVWIDLLCLMAESAERGVLITTGVAWTTGDAARATGGTRQQVQELIDKGVARVRDDGAMYSARMVKDEYIRTVRAQAGIKGGNPDMLKQNPSKPQANAEQTAEQNPTPSSSSSSSSSERSPLSPPTGGQKKTRARRETHQDRLARLGQLTADDATIGGAA